MSNSNRVVAGLVLMAVLALAAACSGDKQKTSNADKVAPLVKTIQLGRSSNEAVIKFPGRVVANKRVDLAFQVTGRITQLPVRKGERTTKGQLLARLDPRDFENDLRAKQADFDKTKRDLSRAAQLLKTGTIAQATYDNALAAYENAIAQLRITQKALDDTKLIAPYDGLVANRFVENFQDIQAKQKIFSYQNISDIDIEIDIPERDIVLTKPIRDRDVKGEELKDALTFDSVPNKKFSVRVKEFVTEADPVTQTFRAVLTMPAPAGINILPGMSATLIVKHDDTNNVYSLPVEAVPIDQKGQRYVWLVNQSNMTVDKRPVNVGHITDTQIEITEGLKTGDRVVVAGLPFLQPGIKVRLYVPKSEAQRQ